MKIVCRRDSRSMQVSVNPRGLDVAYLDGLRVCFPGGWNESSYRWYHKRAFSKRQPDVFAIVDGGRPVAGMAANYRQLELHSGEIVDVAIFTAAWSLPQYRGKWHFSRLIRSGRETAMEAGCIAALSFVLAGNASSAVLARAGAAASPSYYIFAPQSMAICLPGVLPTIQNVGSFDPELGGSNGQARFFYRNACAWRGQLIQRPNPTTSLIVGETLVVLEQAVGTDRLQYVSSLDDYQGVIAALAKRSHQHGRDFFHFTTSRSAAKSAADIGMSVVDGYVKVLELGPDQGDGRLVRDGVLAAGMQIQCGDRM